MLFLVSDSWMYSWYITTGSLINHSSYHITCTLLSLIVIIYLNMNHTSWTFLSLIVECITSGSLISPLRVSDLLSLSRQHLAAQLSPTKYRQYRISIFRILAIQSLYSVPTKYRQYRFLYFGSWLYSLCIRSQPKIGNTEFLYFGSENFCQLCKFFQKTTQFLKKFESSHTPKCNFFHNC